jgi:hypothetical protein
MPFVTFCDVIGANAGNIPAVGAVGLIALYATGTDGIEATTAQVLRFTAAGVGVILIDQTPSLSVFAAGFADVADVEHGAGTFGAAAEAVLHRQMHGWQSTIYLAQNNVEVQEQAFSDHVDRSLVQYGVANWADSLEAAESALDAHENWAYVQYGDPGSNPHVLVPGTHVPLNAANADIDVAKYEWAASFMPEPLALNPLTGLRVTARFTNVTASWDAEPRAAYYVANLREGDGTGKVITSTRVSSTKHKFGALQEGTQYTVRVRAHPSEGVFPSAEGSVTTKKS